MKPLGFAKTRAYWYRFAWGSLLGLIAAVLAFLYAAIMHIGLHGLWHNAAGIAPFSGSWRTVLIMGVAGFLVGLTHRLLPTEEIDVFSAIPEGKLDLEVVPGALLASLFSIIGGFALGPEAPTGILAGGFGVWVSEKRQLSQEIKHTNLFASVAGAFSGLFTAPFAVTAMALELRHRQTGYYYGTLVITTVSALLGFAVFYTLGGNRFSSMLRILDLPSYQLQVWHLLLAVGLGGMAACLSLLFALAIQQFHHLLHPLAQQPILRCTLVGLLMGLLGMAMPLTLFLGSEGLQTVVLQRHELGTGFLLVAIFTKILAVAVVLAAGFIGGPIFPLFFVGGSLGIVLWQLFPALPVDLTVACLMAAVPAALVPFPLTLAIIVLLITGTPVEDAIPVLTAALTAFFLFNGVFLGTPPPQTVRWSISEVDILREDRDMLN